MADKNFESTRSPERKEHGENVEIILKFIRHGERDLEGNLTDLGRETTRERARASGEKDANFDAVKAIGSTGGPRGPFGMPRSLETADIYAREIAGDGSFETRARSMLSYDTMKNEIPFDWSAMYAANLPHDFSGMSSEEKVGATKKAQTAVMNYLIQLDTPEARAYKREAAGALAYVIDHYEDVAKRLRSGSRVLIPAGTHGGVMEFILQQAGVRKDKDGSEVRGFISLDEIGGEFDPSDAFNVDVATDENGRMKPLTIVFDGPNRPRTEFTLDPDKVNELKNYYQKLHKMG